MYIDESVVLEEAYDNLITNITLDNINAFLKACWLIEEGQTLIDSTFERLVYVEGDQQEIYTRMERDRISAISNSAYFSVFQLEASGTRTIDCRLFVIELDSETSVIYDSVTAMKILNKAFDGLNLFMFITPMELHFGCSLLFEKNTVKDCMLSYAINSKTDWELLTNSFLYRNDSKNIYEFYSGIISAFDEIKYCQKHKPEDNFDFRLTDFESIYDIDTLEEDPSLYIEAFASIYSTETNETIESNQEIYRFEKDVESCMEELANIKKTHVNPLEMLFEAEKALLEVEQKEAIEEHIGSVSETNESLTDLSLLNDPIALMKKLKKDRGL